MKKRFINLAILIICIIIVIPNVALAEEINTNEYSAIYNKSGTDKVIMAGGSILGVAQVIGVSVGVIFLVILGVKYMISSTDDKATIKERLIPYVIGAVIMFGGTGILTIIANFAQKL